MGSSSKKHRKESKKHKRSRSESESSDVRVEKDRDSSRHRHRHNRSRKNDDESRSRSGSLIPKSTKSSEDRERRHKHKHKRHKERHHAKEPKRKEDVVVSLDNSDSDSSDCVEVPVDAEAVENAPKPAKKPSEAIRNDEEQLEREQRAKERERDQRDREKEMREREKREREREKEREREFREREHREREMAREREQARDRERERDRDREREQYRDRERDRDQDRYQHQHGSQRESQMQKPSSSSTSTRREPEKRKERSASPIPENGAGDCLSIEETNKIRLKLGLKPLEVDSGPIKPSSSSAEKSAVDEKTGDTLASYKDEWGEFLHKPADNLKDKAQAEKLREKFKQKKEKRMLEEKLKRIRTLGESDEEVDDVEKWVDRNKKKEHMRKEAEMRAKALEEMDAEFGVDDLMEKEKREARRKAYNDNHLRGLRVDHDMEDFSEGKTVILTLKDKCVLDEDDDALVNVNMMDDEHYRKNVINKKKNPLSYGYDVYEEQYDMLGNPIDRGILEKYDEEIEGAQRKKNFVIGENLEERKEQQRKLLEIKTKLAGKRLETLEDTRIQLASDTYTEVEMAKFKKPKKKVKKIRKKLKADDLLPLAEEPSEQHYGRRLRVHGEVDDDVELVLDNSEMKHNLEEEDDLQRVLSKARKLKQKESLIKKTLPLDVTELKAEVKEEPEDDDEQANGLREEGHITLNATAEFCRTLGDIPTYGMAGNRDEDSNDMMDYEVEERVNEAKQEEPEASTGTWNSVNPEDVIRPMEDDISNDLGDVAILDEEPDVGAGVGNALKLALSKGYLEKDDKNRPSNSKLSYLQAKNYSIEDKSAGDDDKFGRRDRFHSGPIMEFRDKETFKPNVKLEYIDDNGRILNLKEAFRYLSHKFHGKGPGKNKIEKRLKKMEQDGLMKTMSSTDTPLGTLTMLQQKQKETKTPYVVLSGGKQAAAVSNTTISKYK